MSTKNELKISLPTDTTIVWERAFDAPRDLVFEVMTDPQHLPKWMANYGYQLDATGEVRPGGSYRNLFHSGSSEDFALYGEFREVERPSRLVFTENMEGMDGPPAVNDVRLEERDGRTYMTLTMTFATKEQRDAVIATGMAEGAAVSYNQLDAYIHTLSR